MLLGQHAACGDDASIYIPIHYFSQLFKIWWTRDKSPWNLCSTTYCCYMIAFIPMYCGNSWKGWLFAKPSIFRLKFIWNVLQITLSISRHLSKASAKPHMYPGIGRCRAAVRQPAMGRSFEGAGVGPFWDSIFLSLASMFPVSMQRSGQKASFFYCMGLFAQNPCFGKNTPAYGNIAQNWLSFSWAVAGPALKRFRWHALTTFQ